MGKRLSVLFLDLGDTLVHGDALLPHVPEALKVLEQLPTPDGRALLTGLVSDYTMPEPPVTHRKKRALFDEYVSRLEGYRLRAFFEPVDARVTLSTQAGALKPDRRVFELAIERLNPGSPLSACMFVTENPGHVAATRALGMTSFQFGVDFADWIEGPLVIAHAIGVEEGPAFGTALRQYLDVQHGVKVFAIDGKPPEVLAHVKTFIPVEGPSLGSISGVHVELPTSARVRFNPQGRVDAVDIEAPQQESVDEARAFVAGLVARDEIAPGDGITPPAYEVATNAGGRRILRRRRATASN
jgi:FMN phosphatase YigB (HAD superfamily)